MLVDPSLLEAPQIEALERLTLRWMCQAVLDFGWSAYEIFLRSPDAVQDVAEDVTRELLDRLPGYTIPERVFETVDYKRARYIFLPDYALRQALFVDSKAEKETRTATIQMSQISMQVRHVRSGIAVNEVGHLPSISTYRNQPYLTTTAFLHFTYEELNALRHLRAITAFIIPNGQLQASYNPTVEDTIWLAGRNAPTLGEDFRVRLSFVRLKAKAKWRVQHLLYHQETQSVQGTWDE